MEPDRVDRKILLLLSEDCRMSVAQMARRIRASREVVDYRIRRLLRNGIIKSFCTDIDLGALGYTKHVVYLELKGTSKQKEEEIFRKLKENKFVSWIVTSTGRWSVIFDIHSRNTEHLSHLVRSLKHELGRHIGEYEIVTLEDYGYFHSKFFGGEEPRKKAASPYVPDETDLLLLKLLSKNARMSCVELARMVELTPEAVGKRIRRLREIGIVRRFYIFPDLAKLGFEHYNVQINLENIRNEKEREITAYLEHHPSVSFLYKPISHWDIEFGVFVRNPGELRTFMQDLRTHYPENIRIKDIMLFYEEQTANFLPEGVFEVPETENRKPQ
ncbi:MAG: winged helix-turn-helix transcriptional regulator [Candidatus Micrarchaeota archaeon]